MRRLAAKHDVRLSFHPDQFVVPGSSDPETAEKSLRELEHHAEVGALLGAVQMTIHGGGRAGLQGRVALAPRRRPRA